MHCLAWSIQQLALPPQLASSLEALAQALGQELAQALTHPPYKESLESLAPYVAMHLVLAELEEPAALLALAGLLVQTVLTTRLPMLPSSRQWAAPLQSVPWMPQQKTLYRNATVVGHSAVRTARSMWPPPLTTVAASLAGRCHLQAPWERSSRWPKRSVR